MQYREKTGKEETYGECIEASMRLPLSFIEEEKAQAARKEMADHCTIRLLHHTKQLRGMLGRRKAEQKREEKCRQ